MQSGPYPEGVKDRLRYLRGKCGRLQLVYEPDQRSRSRGRKPRQTGLLIALDAICLHGIEWTGPGRLGTLLVVSFRKGRRWKAVTEVGMDGHVEEMLAHLETRWGLSTETIRDHSKRNQGRALQLLTDLLHLPWEPRVSLSEVEYAVADHWSGAEFRSIVIERQLPGIAFNLFPYLRRAP